MSFHLQEYIAGADELPRRQRVLLVEDDLMWQTIIKQTVLEGNYGIDLQCVKSAEDGVLLLSKNEKYDLIMSDQYLNGKMTGVDLWKQCQTKHQAVPFVIVSGMKTPKFLESFSTVERPSFIEKDFEIDRFKAAIKLQFDRMVASFRSSDKFLDRLLKCSLAATVIAAGLFGATLLQSKTETPVKAATSIQQTAPKATSSEAHQFVTAALIDQVQRIAGRVGADGDFTKISQTTSTSAE